MNTFNWNQYEPVGEQPEQKEELDWSQFEPVEQQPEQKEETGIGQRIASFGAHALGAIPALPGNLREIVYAAGDEAKNVRKKFMSTLGLSWDEDYLKDLQDKVGESPTAKKLEEYAAPYKFLINKLPTSQDVNKFIDKSFEGYLAPKDEKQKFANEIGEDVVNSFLNRGPKNLYRNFAIPALTNVLKKGLDVFGVDPETSNIAKVATWIGMDMAGLANPRQMAGNLINRSRRIIPQNETIQMSPRDIRFLDQLENRLTSGGTSPSKTASLTKITEYRNSVQPNGRIPARQVHDFYRTINELKTNYGAFDVEGAAKPAHIFNLNRMQNLTRNQLNRYGRTQNPRFLNDFREANSAWASLEQSDAIAGYVKKHYNKPFVHEATRLLFSKPYGIPVAVGLTALERAQAVLQRLQNPTLRRYYGNVLQASMEDNRAMMIHNLKKLDEHIDDNQ